MCYVKEYFHVKDDAVHRMWILTNIFEVLRMLFFFAVRTWVDVCVLREVDCILKEMLNSKRRKEIKLNSLLLPSCSYLSETVKQCATAVSRAAQSNSMPSVFHQLWGSPSFTELRLTFLPLKRKKSKTVIDSETHCYERYAFPSLPFELTLLWFFFFIVFNFLFQQICAEVHLHKKKTQKRHACW